VGFPGAGQLVEDITGSAGEVADAYGGHVRQLSAKTALVYTTSHLREACKLRVMSEPPDTLRNVMRLAAEREDWIPVLRAAAAEAERCEPYGVSLPAAGCSSGWDA